MLEFRRSIETKLVEELKKPQVVLLFGPRQVGKSYLLNLLTNKVRGKFSYYDLEQPKDISQFAGDDSDVHQLLVDSGKVIFIDEFHYLKNAGKAFKAIYDLGKRDKSKQIKIFASGSSAIEMHKHIKESMAGRVHRYRLMPLLLDEYLSVDLADLSINEYYIYGGLPELYQYSGEDRATYLNGVLETYIQRDIKSLIKEENISSFNKLLYMLAQHQGQIVSVSNLANDLTISAQTVQSYLDILEQTYTLYTLKSFSTNLSNELKKSKKYYFYDLGLRNALLKNFSRIDKRNDIGIILETYAYHYLLSIANRANTDIYFWRTTKGQEVDFVWQKNQVPVPIEVKSKYEEGHIPSGLEAFFRAYPLCQKAVILFNKSKSIDEYKELVHNGRKVYLVNINVSHKYLPEILNEL